MGSEVWSDSEQKANENPQGFGQKAREIRQESPEARPLPIFKHDTLDTDGANTALPTENRPTLEGDALDAGGACVAPPTENLPTLEVRCV